MSSELNMSYRKNLLSQLSNLFDDDTSHSSVTYKSSLDDTVNGISEACHNIVDYDLRQKLTTSENLKNEKIDINVETVVTEDYQQIEANKYNQQIAENEDYKQIKANEDHPINVKQKRDRADSIEEVKPDDPFGDILEGLTVDLKVEPQDIKEELLEYEAGEDFEMDDYPEDEVHEEKKPNNFRKNQKRLPVSKKNSNPERYFEKLKIKKQPPPPPGERKLRHKKTNPDISLTKTMIQEISRIRETTDFYQDHTHNGYPTSLSKNGCKVCGITFKKKGDQKKHISNTQKENLVCSICSKILKGNHILNLHFVTKHNVKPEEFTFLCPRCPSKFYNASYRNLHMIFRHKISDFKYNCGFCSKSYSHEKSYLKHVYSHSDHNNGVLVAEEVLQCGGCEALNPNETSLLNHMSTVHKLNGLSLEITECEKCGLTLTSARNLRRHIKNVHSECTYNCWKCDASYKNTDALRKHFQRNHSEKYSKIINNEQELKCVECGSTFTSTYVTSAWTRLKEHMHRKHPGVNSTEPGGVPEEPLEAECQQCGKLCTETNFYQHTREEHKQPSTLQRCTKCVYKTYDGSLFAEHLEIHIDGEQIYKCWYEGCDYVSAKEKNLDKHIFHQHEEVMKCELCSFETKNSLLMKNHIHGHEMGTHDSDNVSPFDQFKEGDNFKCELCDFTARFFSALWIHKKRSHTDKLIKCNKCPYVTHLYDNMKRHYSTHNGRTYKCLLCSFQTKYPNSVETHKKLKHPNVKRTKFQCDLCSFSSLYRAYLMVHKQVKHKSKETNVNTKEQNGDKSIEIKTEQLVHNEA